MKKKIRYQRSLSVVVLIMCIVLLLARCIHNGNEETGKEVTADFKRFAGNASCAGCHKAISESHRHTAHHLTSGIADEKNIKGSFETGSNSFAFTPNTSVFMEKRADGYFQVAYSGEVEKLARRFDIVVGSGTKGQSYLFWAGNNLFQLPITYFTAANQWCNSPGYPGKVIFNRPITSRCLECHSTYAKVLADSANKQEAFDRSSMLYGVSCESCHGPAADHVAYQTQHPTEKKGKFIVNPAALSRQQQLDQCGLCHGGRMQKTKPSFSFMPGGTLADYFVRDTGMKSANNIDVHGNQLGLLAASKCFMSSKKMTCNTCHNSHENEAGKTALFSQRCSGCHTEEHVGKCKMTAALGGLITNNCIDCHMPMEPSKAITVLLQGAEVPSTAAMRTHYIKIYPEQTKAFMERLKQFPNKKSHQ